MIEARGLTRRYGEFTAVRDISFSVPDREILGILGPNGAGKTTTIRMMTGFLPPTAGQVTLDGVDLHENPHQAKKELGYLPENVALYPEMRVSEYLRYRARLAGLTRGKTQNAIDEALSGCLLEPVRSQIISTLSKGYRQRVGLAAAILHGPRVLILDEPTVGLDPKQIIAIRELIKSLGRDRTLLLSTHILPEVEQICDRVLIIDRGSLIAEGTPSELRAKSGGKVEVRVTLQDHGHEAAELLGNLDGVVDVHRDTSTDGRFRLACGERDIRRDVFQLAVDQGWALVELSEQRLSLEEVFVRLTTDSTAGQSPSAATEPSATEPSATEPATEPSTAAADSPDQEEQ